MLTQNVFLVIAIVGLILYSMVHTKQDQNNTVAYTIAGIAVVAALYAIAVNLHFIPGSETLAENVLYGSIILVVGFVIYGFMTHNSPEFGRTVVLMILILSTIVFWALFEQSAGSMTLYADRVVDRSIGDTTFTAAQFGSLNAGFIMLLAIPFAALWTWLAKKELEPSTPVKFGLGILQAGLGFGALVYRRTVTGSVRPGRHDLADTRLPAAHHRRTLPVARRPVRRDQAVYRQCRRRQHGYLVPRHRAVRNGCDASRQAGGDQHGRRRSHGDAATRWPPTRSCSSS